MVLSLWVDARRATARWRQRFEPARRWFRLIGTNSK
jgi:hypothetical protein